MVDRIKALCRAQNTSVTKLEVALGFGNGTIGKWKNAKGAPPADKLQMVADALGVTSEYLLNGENENKPILMDELEMGNVSDIKMKMIGLIQDMPDDVLIKWYELLEAQAAQYKK